MIDPGDEERIEAAAVVCGLVFLVFSVLWAAMNGGCG